MFSQPPDSKHKYYSGNHHYHDVRVNIYGMLQGADSFFHRDPVTLSMRKGLWGF